MGSAVSVGVLADYIENDEEVAEWFRAELDNVNRLLVAVWYV